MENYASLVAKGYRTIIGFRDAYADAKTLAEVPHLRRSLIYKIQTDHVMSSLCWE
jgi:hypothetical protein